jgi:hypothetical protein
MRVTIARVEESFGCLQALEGWSTEFEELQQIFESVVDTDLKKPKATEICLSHLSQKFVIKSAQRDPHPNPHDKCLSVTKD